MALDLQPLAGVERPGLVQDRVGDAELAEVVEDARRPHALDPRRREAELARDLLAVAPDRLRVARGGDVAEVERLGEQHRRRQLLRPAAALGVPQRVEHLERLRVVHDAAVAAEPLGGVQRAVGGPHQLAGVARLRPAAGTPTETDTGQPKVANSPRTSSRTCSAAASAAASPAPGSTSANSSPPSRVGTSASRAAGAQHLGEAAQDVVAGVVAERVVDALEVVEVDHQQRQLAARAELVEVPVDRELEAAAVAQPGQRIVGGEVLELLEPPRGLDRAHRLVGEHAQRLQRLGRGQQPVLRVVDPDHPVDAARPSRTAAPRPSGGSRPAARGRCRPTSRRRPARA